MVSAIPLVLCEELGMLSRVANHVCRFSNTVRRHGWKSSLQKFATHNYNRWFRDRVVVWLWRHGEPLHDDSVGVEVLRFDSADQIPPGVLAGLIQQDDDTFFDRLTEEFTGEGALWVARIDGITAGYQWQRRGHLIKDWYLNLTERDVVIYSAVTFPAFRGRRVARAMMAAICRQEVQAGGFVSGNCMIWNTPSMRLFQGTGFTKLFECPTMANHQY